MTETTDLDDYWLEEVRKALDEVGLVEVSEYQIVLLSEIFLNAACGAPDHKMILEVPNVD